jgi:hypothetical protein
MSLDEELRPLRRLAIDMLRESEEIRRQRQLAISMLQEIESLGDRLRRLPSAQTPHVVPHPAANNTEAEPPPTYANTMTARANRPA